MASSSATRDYDGAGDYLDSGDSSTYDFTSGGMSVVAWTYIDSLPTRSPYISNRQTGSPFNGWNYRLENNSANDYMSITVNGGSGPSSTTTVGTTAWEGVSCTWDIGTDANFYTVTKTGSLTSDLANASAATPTASSANLRIGEVGGEYLNGATNYTQVFNRELSVNEIQNAWWAPGSVTNGLVLYWPGYGQLSPEPDLSTTGSDGTVTGTGGTRNEACPAIPQQMPIM